MNTMTRVGLVPADWMPDARMSRIHIHWSAGRHAASENDRLHYHILVESDGTLVRGVRGIDANAPGSGKTPVSHTLNANTGAIGVSVCCMEGAIESPFNAGRWPMTEAQWRRMIEVVAELARRYAIPVTPRTVLTHAEVQPTLGITQRGKWDITRLAFDDGVRGHKAVGDKLRREVALALDAGEPEPGPIAPPDAMRLPRFRVRGVKPSTLNFRDAPGGTKVGALTENTLVERFALFGEWSQVRTPAGHVGWVASSYLAEA